MGKASSGGCMKPWFSQGPDLQVLPLPGAVGLSHWAAAHICGAPGRVKEMVDCVVRLVALCSLGGCGLGVPCGQTQERRYKASVPAEGAVHPSRSVRDSCLSATGPRQGVREWKELLHNPPGPASAEGQWQLVRVLANFQPQRSSQTPVSCLSRPCGSARTSQRAFLPYNPISSGTFPKAALHCIFVSC